jgi:hypothetical protein
MSTQIVETYLPIFPGFYNSLIDGDFEIDNFLSEEDLSYEQINFDFKSYSKDCSFYACNFIENELKDFGVLSVKFQEIISPKYYNFSTDSINCEIEIEPEKIRFYIHNNFENFREYIYDNYSHKSGFISSYSNFASDWITNTSNFSDFTQNKHYLGAILTFICQNEGIEPNQMSSYILENIWIGNFIDILEKENN